MKQPTGLNRTLFSKGMIGKAAMEAGFVSYLNRGVKVPKEQGRRCEA